MLGSSVVYGLDTSFADTIPGAVERELAAGGHRAEVLNFGTHGFTIVNVSALLQAYVHQFQPDVVVVVVDVQVGLPRWPPVQPGGEGGRRRRGARRVGGAAQARRRRRAPCSPFSTIPGRRAGGSVAPAACRSGRERRPAPRLQPTLGRDRRRCRR